MLVVSHSESNAAAIFGCAGVGDGQNHLCIGYLVMNSKVGAGQSVAHFCSVSITRWTNIGLAQQQQHSLSWAIPRLHTQPVVYIPFA